MTSRAILLGIILFLVFLLILLLVYLKFSSSFAIWFLPTYNNNVLDLIKLQQSWGVYSGTTLLAPYNFKIVSYNATSLTGTMQISYFDNAGLLMGNVSFNANFQVMNNNNIKILPVSVISTATNRWPSGQIWTLTYNSATSLSLNTGSSVLALGVF